MIQDLSTAEEATVNATDGVSTSCFEQCLFSDIQFKVPILCDQFKTSERKIVYLLLHPTYLVQSPTQTPKPQTKVKVCTFTFDSTFFVSPKKSNDAKEYCALKLLDMKNKKSESYYSKDVKMVSKWAAILISYINQIGIQAYYETVKHLGKGVSADVYLAKRITDSKQFAIKVFNKSKNNEKCLNAFINQLKIMRLLRHPNIAKLYGVFVSNEFVYAILEYLDGGNLYQQIKLKKKYTKNEQFLILQNLTEGIQHLRLKRIVHRDLKLENIMVRNVDSKKEYVICDFGLATWLDETSYIFQKCGTPGYIAPEILRLARDQKLQLTNKVDTFSLGSIFHVVLLLRPVFLYESGFEALIKLNKKAEIDWSQGFYLRMPQEQLKMLQMMLNPLPDKRIGSDGLLKLDYFKKKKSTVQVSELSKIGISKTDNLQSMVVNSQKFLKSTDKVGGSKVKQQRQTSLNRNSSLTRQIKLERKDSEKRSSSILDYFRKKKSTADSTDTTKSPKNSQVKTMINMSSSNIGSGVIQKPVQRMISSMVFAAQNKTQD